jgi:hypothetical protein
MCFADVLERLREAGIAVTESQLRWAIRGGHVQRPKLDGSLRFKFSEENVAELVEYFRSRELTVA